MKTISCDQVVQDQRAFFETHTTKTVSFRIAQLKKLRSVIIKNESHIIEAVQKDLGKSALDAYFSAIHLCIKEIDYALKHIHNWTQKKTIRTPLALWPMRSAVQPQPYGIVLIISTWNYPFNLNILPLVGAIAAGNCAIIKPSYRATHSEQLLANMIHSTFDHNYVHVMRGEADVADELLTQRFDSIFLSGSTVFAKKVFRAAAEHLTPVSLELGGKSPCIVDHTASINLAAKKIVWGKYLNTGQNCVSPDYVLVDHNCKQLLIEAIKKYITLFYGSNPQQSPSYGRIIDQSQQERLEQLMKGCRVVYGGTVDTQDRYISPTIVEVDSLEHPIMHEEVFGPILPVITFETIDDALAIYRNNPQPLAVYLFSHDKNTLQRIQTETASGAFGINELVLQTCSTELPFGGIGRSGMGKYHGKATFDTFSNTRAIIESRWPELPFRYPNYPKAQAFFKKLLQLLSL